jgi:hypothetical protein
VRHCRQTSGRRSERRAFPPFLAAPAARRRTSAHVAVSPPQLQAPQMMFGTWISSCLPRKVTLVPFVGTKGSGSNVFEAVKGVVDQVWTRIVYSLSCGHAHCWAFLEAILPHCEFGLLRTIDWIAVWSVWRYRKECYIEDQLHGIWYPYTIQCPLPDASSMICLKDEDSKLRTIGTA